MANSVTRRAAITVAGGAFFSARNLFSGQDASLHVTSLDHASITVSDVQKSVNFYTAVFGNTLRKENESSRYYVKLDASYLAMAQPGRNSQAGRIDHFCAGFKSTEMASAKIRLTQLGVKFTEPPPFGLFFPDPEGIRVQMWSENSWTDVAKTTSPVAQQLAASPIFSPMRLDHLLLAVADVEKESAYYAKLFGSAVHRTTKDKIAWVKLGPSRLGLIPAAPGEASRIQRVSVSVTPFNRTESMKKLQELGAHVDDRDREDTLQFTDTDGIAVEVIATK